MSEYRPVPFTFERLDREEMQRRSEAFLELMRTRRSVRMFSHEPVPFELIRNAIEVAGTAPSAAHQQPRTFVVVSDPELKQRIRDGAEAEELGFYTRDSTAEWRGAVKHIGTDHLKPHITDAPYVVVVFEHAYGRGDDGEKAKHYWVKESVGIAVGFFLAALQASGLCALTHTPSPMRFLGDILDRPGNERPYVLIPVGYPADDAPVPELVRKPLDEIMVVR